MTSQINPSVPAQGAPTTASVRANFATAQQEISALQTNTQGAPFLPVSGGTMQGVLTLHNDPTGLMQPVTLGYFQANGGGGGGGSGGIPDAVADGTLYGRKDGAWVNALPITGGEITGALKIDTTLQVGAASTLLGNVTLGSNTAAVQQTINGPSGASRSILLQSAGEPRWVIKTDGSAESGSNAGAGFNLDAYNDAGTLIGHALAFTRATGLGTVIGDPIEPTGIATKRYADTMLPLNGGTLTGALTINQNTAPQLQITGAAGNVRVLRFATGSGARFHLGLDAAAESGGNAGSNFVMTAYTDAGGAQAPAMTIARGTGLITIAADPIAPLGIVTKRYADAIRAGSNDGSVASPGQIGEVINASAGNVYGGGGAWLAGLSMSIPAGDWDVSAEVMWYVGSGNTVTQFVSAITPNNAAPTGTQNPTAGLSVLNGGSCGNYYSSLGPMQFVGSSTMTAFIMLSSQYSGPSSNPVNIYMRARRMR